MDSKHDKIGSKALADDNPGLERLSAPRFSRNTFRSPQPNLSQIFQSLLLPGDGDQEFEAASRPGDIRKEGRPRFQDNTEKSKAYSGTSGLRSHDPRCRSASPRPEKVEMRLYRPPRSNRPQAPPNTMASKLSVRGLPGDLSERGVEFIFKKFGEVEKVTMVRDEVCFVTMGISDQANAATKQLNGKNVKRKTIRVEHVERYPNLRSRAYEDEGRPWDSKREVGHRGLSRQR